MTTHHITRNIAHVYTVYESYWTTIAQRFQWESSKISRFLQFQDTKITSHSIFVKNTNEMKKNLGNSGLKIWRNILLTLLLKFKKNLWKIPRNGNTVPQQPVNTPMSGGGCNVRPTVAHTANNTPRDTVNKSVHSHEITTTTCTNRERETKTLRIVSFRDGTSLRKMKTPPVPASPLLRYILYCTFVFGPNICAYKWTMAEAI